MDYAVNRYVKEKTKKILLKSSFLFCTPLSRDDTRSLSFLKRIHSTDGFELESLTINGAIAPLDVKIVYPDSILFKAENPKDKKIFILPSGGICVGNKILCSGFNRQQAYNVAGYLQSYFNGRKKLSGTIVCSWPQQFFTYGDFVLQLLPELCLIKSLVAYEDWLSAHFILPNTPRFLTDYLHLLGCEQNQIINSKSQCFDLSSEAQIYFREKDPMHFLCAPSELVHIARKYLVPQNLLDEDRDGEILFIERLNGYRRAIGLTEDIRLRLSDIGVKFFDPACVSVKEQIETFAKAKLVVGIHGAGLANILWCQKQTKVIEIFHPNFAPWCYALLANHLDIDYYCLGSDPGPMNVNYRESDVNVDWSYLIELIKRLTK